MHVSNMHLQVESIGLGITSWYIAEHSLGSVIHDYKHSGVLAEYN